MRFLVPLLAALWLVACETGRVEPPRNRWWRGNTHTHTLWSDGDGAPEEVVDWYVRHGYSFLVLSDHNVLSEGERWVPVGEERGQVSEALVAELVARFGASVVVREKDARREMRLKTLAELKAAFEEKGRFLMIQGEEISDWFEKKPVHHGALNLAKLISPTGGDSVRDVLARTVRAVEEEERRSGRPLLVHLNHPNYDWAVTADDLAHVLGERFFEVYNGHRLTHNEGDATRPATERIWDIALTLRLAELGGEPLYALATDDAHDYHKTPWISNPGRGWIVVRAPSLEAGELLGAMKRGDFYASSGVALEDVAVWKDALSISIAAEPGVTYTTRFFGTRIVGNSAGEPGVVLKEVEGASPSYRFAGDELYVRATVVSSRLHPNGYLPTDHESAWVQPVRPGGAPARRTRG